MSSLFPHDEQIVEPAQVVIPLLRRLAVIAHFQRLVVPDNADDIDRLKMLAQPRVQLESNGMKYALAAAMLIAVTDVQCHVAVRLEHPPDLSKDLVHRVVVRRA